MPCQVFCSAWGMFILSQEATSTISRCLRPGPASARTWGQAAFGGGEGSCDDASWLGKLGKLRQE